MEYLKFGDELDLIGDFRRYRMGNHIVSITRNKSIYKFEKIEKKINHFLLWRKDRRFSFVFSGVEAEKDETNTKIYYVEMEDSVFRYPDPEEIMKKGSIISLIL